MFNIIAFCAFVLGLSRGVISQKCVDCMNYDLCPVALDLALHSRTDDTMELFQQASCGYDNSGTMSMPKVCCSMFSTTFKAGDSIDSPEDIRIVNHRSQRLLPAECGEIKGDRIVGGTIADLYEFPWMALISHETRDGLSFKCGGSIINQRYILTAAHCIHKKTVAGVRVGEYNIDTEVDCQKDACERHIQDIPVEKLIVHQNYKGLPSVLNDIALIRLSEDIDFNHRNVHKICLPRTSKLRHEPLSNMFATVTGWGITEDHVESSVLRKVSIPIYPAQNCSGIYNRFARPGQPDATTDQLCAGSQNKDSCNGDSGGPLMLERKYNNIDRYVQYGIVSHGPQLCGSDYPGVYTEVTKFMGWILDNIY